MTLKAWLKQFEHMDEAFLNKEVFIEAPNGLLFTPVLKKKWKKVAKYTIDNLECIVIAFD